MPRLLCLYYLKFQNSKFEIQNLNSKFKIEIHNLKSKFEIQSKFEIPNQNQKFKIYEPLLTYFKL